MKFHFSSFLAFLLSIPFIASAQLLPKNFQQIIGEVEKECIDFRRHFHEFPELSNREFNTGKFIAERLRKEGLDVQHPVAKTGVVAVLTGGKPGPAIALRADIDALPITERTPVPFASKVKTTFNGQEVGVMHACGHDAHTAILMATAIALKRMQKEVPGTIVFLFQPAEEGAPSGEEGGAPLMIKEGLLDNPKVNAVFGLHMASELPAGQITYKSGAAQASSDLFKITVKGKGSHGSMPWKGVDPIIVSAQILQALQTIVSRQEDLTKAPVVITVGSMHSGVRSNIIPETAEMSGTIRSLDEQMREDVHQRMRLTVKSIAESAGATADIEIVRQTLVNYNDPALTAKMIPSLMKAAGEENVLLKGWVTAAEDFSFYREKAPTFFFSLGGLAPNATPDQAGPHHTPDFSIDESGFIIGIKAFCQMVFDYSR